MNTQIFLCKRSRMHSLHATADEQSGSLKLSVYLSSHRDILDRLGTAIKYVLGLDHSYHFDDFILQNEDVARLASLVEPLVPQDAEFSCQDALNKIDCACDGKVGDEACCSLVVLRKNGYELTKIERKEGFDLKLRKKEEKQ